MQGKHHHPPFAWRRHAHRMGPGDGPGGGGFGPPWARGWGGPPLGMFGMGPLGALFGRPQKAARGDVRAGILALLADDGPMHGYQLMREMGERSGGAWRPSPGSVYPALTQLEEDGLVTSEKEGGRRIYSITDAGREEAEAATTDGPPWENLAAEPDDDLVALRDLAFGAASAVMQVATSGSTEQVSEAKRILADTRRQLYLLLAGDDVDGD